MQTLAHRRNHRSGGFVLISVLWILAILTVISLGFARRAMLERRMAWYALDNEQAQQMARAAAQRGMFELQNKMILDLYNEQTGYTGLDQRWARPIDLLAEGSYFVAGKEDAEGDVCEVWIEDAESLISLNYAPETYFESLKSINKRTVSRLLKLREPSTPYRQRTLLHSVEELRGMQDIADKDWYGVPGRPGLEDVLTVWGDPAYGRLNVNTASAQALSCLPGMDPEVAQRIVAARNGPDRRPRTADDLSFINLGMVGQKLEVSAEKLAPIHKFCKTDSRFFTIHAHASRRRGKINAYCTVTVEMRGTIPAVLAWREGAGGA